MSDGYTVEDIHGETIGIVVRKESGRGFRFFSATRAFDALDGHVFASAEAAQRAARDIGRSRNPAKAARQHRMEAHT